MSRFKLWNKFCTGVTYSTSKLKGHGLRWNFSKIDSLGYF